MVPYSLGQKQIIQGKCYRKPEYQEMGLIGAVIKMPILSLNQITQFSLVCRYTSPINRSKMP